MELKDVGPPKDEFCQVASKSHHLFKSYDQPQECHETTQMLYCKSLKMMILNGQHEEKSKPTNKAAHILGDKIKKTYLQVL